MRADEQLSERVLEADSERRVLRATGVKAAEEQSGLRTTNVKAGEEKKVAEEKEDAVMTNDVRAIDDAEALKVWSELSGLDPKIRGDTYVSEDG
eukprot:4797899-Amphidinium_carterae.1